MNEATADRPGVGPIGLDLGDRTIRAAQVRRGDRGPALHAAACIRRLRPGQPLDDGEMRRLMGVLARHGFEGGRVAVALPEEKLLTNTLEHVGAGPGAGAGAPMEVVSRVELARAAGCTPPQLEVACWQLPAPARARQSSHVLAVGCLHSEADALLDAVECCGLRADALEPRAVALARACRPLLAGRQGICAILDVGWEGTTTAVVYQGVIVYHRFMTELGVGVAAQALTSGLGIDDELAAHLLLGRSALPGPAEGGPRVGVRADAEQLMSEHASRLTHELGLSLSYASHWYAQPQVDAVLLCGEGAAMPGLAGMLTHGLGTEVRVTAPRDLPLAGADAWWPGEPVDPSRTGAELMTALGLALR